MAVITSTNYWSTVFSELQEEIERNGHAKYLYIAKRYDEVIRLIEDRIRAWYGRHALDNKISLKQAYKKLPADQLEMFKDLIDTYLRNWNEELGYDLGEKPIDHAEKVSEKDTTSESDASEVYELNDTEAWITYLQGCKNRDDITYFESLAIPVLNEVEKASFNTAETLLLLLTVTGWTVHFDIAKNLKIQGLTQEALKKELLKSWASDGMSLYERFSRNKNMLSASVKSALVKGFRNEMTVDQVITEVSKVMEGGQFAAKRLVTTENTHFNCYSTMLAMKRAGYEFYKINAVIDAKTCEDCISWNGDIYNINDYEPNVTAPPQHSHCRCYVTPANLKEIE